MLKGVDFMDTFRSLSDEQLMEAYEQAITLSMESDFIKLLKKELDRRSINYDRRIHQ